VKRNLQIFAHEAARKIFASGDETVEIGAGEDDTAVLQVGNQRLLVSSDYVNFKRISDQYNGKDYYDLGRYCVRQNVSDILGSGGVPRWFMLSALLDNECTEKELISLFEGVRHECDRLKLSVVGGDTKQGVVGAVHGTIIGTLEGDAWNKGPISDQSELFVTGPISGVTAALCLLEFSENTTYRQAALQTLHDADLPTACIEVLRKKTFGLCASDISDGLGYTLHEFLRVNSGLCLDLEISRIPLHPLTKIAAEELGLHERSFCFGFGGDFQVALVSSHQDHDAMRLAGAIRIGAFRSGNKGKLTNNSMDIGELPDFGHLDFEDVPPAERFKVFATGFSRTLIG